MGDRYEVFSFCICCYFLNIPIVHIHGGEVTEGSYDDNFRHSLTKFSHFHFVSNKTFKKRVIQLGEQPKNVYVVGGLGVDNIKNTKLLSSKYLENKFRLKKINFLVTFHPVTLENSTASDQIFQLLKALDSIHNCKIIFTKSNSDTEVILELFSLEGISSVNKLRGMFSFVIWDNDKNELFLFRDRLGIKPMYYNLTKNYELFFSYLLNK